MHELGRCRDGRSAMNFAIYHDRYERTPEGWRFTERVYELLYLDTTPLTGRPPRPGRPPRARERPRDRDRHHPRQHPPEPQRRAGRRLGARTGARTTDAEFDLVDLPTTRSPTSTSRCPPRRAGTSTPTPRAWSSKIATYDGFVLVTPEYNHSTSAVLKNALDHLYAEWNNKSVGLVSYGGTGGVRAAEHLRLVCGAMQMADVSHQVAVPMAAEFVDKYSRFEPSTSSVASLDILLDQVVSWASALAPLRAAAS